MPAAGRQTHHAVARSTERPHAIWVFSATDGPTQSFFFSFTFTDWVLGSPPVGV